MDEEQKANVRVLVNEAIEKRKNDLGYQYLIKKFGEDYCTLIPNALTVSEKNSFYYFKNSIKDDIQKGAKDVKKRGRKIKTSFFEFFYTAAMTEEEKKEINKKIINILNEYKHLKGYECIIRRYSETLDKIDYSVSYDKTQKSEVEFLKRTIKFKLNNENTKEKRNNKLSFYDYFYEEGMDLDRKAKLEIRVKSILEENKHLAGYYVITKLFSENLNTKNKEEVLTNSDKAAMFYMIKKIKEQLAKPNEANKETIKNESIIGRNQEKKIESKEIPNKLNYADTIIYKLTEMGYSIDKIAVILNTDINFILESYINNIDYYHINFVIDMILKYNPKYLINLLNSGYFKELLNEITSIEKQLIYYLILAKNDKMDIEDISKIMSISIEDIMNYQIYSKEDRYNELNDYIHLSNDKKRKISF